MKYGVCGNCKNITLVNSKFWCKAHSKYVGEHNEIICGFYLERGE